MQLGRVLLRPELGHSAGQGEERGLRAILQAQPWTRVWLARDCALGQGKVEVLSSGLLSMNLGRACWTRPWTSLAAALGIAECGSVGFWWLTSNILNVLFLLRQGLAMVPRLSLNSWAQAILWSQPPE